MKQPTFPNESPQYRDARAELLDAEAALRRQTENVAALRRALPLGGRAKKDYVFEEIAHGGGVREVRLSELFQPEKCSLFIYGFMYGPNAKQPCPLCTAILDGLNGNAKH